MSRKRWIWLGAAGAVVLVLAIVAYALRDDFTYAGLASGYAAKQTCSCRYVSGRSLQSCMADFPEDAQRALTVRATNGRVRASVLFGAISSEAEYEEGYGCTVLR